MNLRTQPIMQTYQAENGETVNLNEETQTFIWDDTNFELLDVGTHTKVVGEDWELPLFDIYQLGPNEFHGEAFDQSRMGRTVFETAMKLLETII